MEGAKVIAKDLGFFLTHSSTKSNDGEKYPRIYLHCHRGYKNNTYVPDPDKKGRSNTKSLKDGCRFRVRLVGLPEEKTWMIDGVKDNHNPGQFCGFHNHALELYPEGHTQRNAFTNEELKDMKEMEWARVAPRKMMQTINQNYGTHHNKRQ
ncbi:unnamed protein product [Linum tenue]|nr:unnamed protein product [Linum tenue]